MISCHEATRLMSESLDHPLPPGQRWRLRLHLFFCKYCSRFLVQSRWLHQFSAALLRGQAHPPGNETLSQHARERIRNAIDSENRPH